MLKRVYICGRFLQILLCGDSLHAKSCVAQLCRRLGFIPIDMGLLSSALNVENLPLHLFPCWRVPLLCTLLLFAAFYAYNFARDVLQPYVTQGKNQFHKMPIETVNVTLPSVALVLLSLVYLPGLGAAALQLRRGTKYRRFPGWLDRWLQCRKQLGLCSFLCAALHAVYSLVLPMRKSARNKLIAMAAKHVGGEFYTTWILLFFSLFFCFPFLNASLQAAQLNSLCIGGMCVNVSVSRCLGW